MNPATLSFVKFQLWLVFVCMSFMSNAQFFRGINGLRPYEKKLEQIDTYLNVSPELGKKIIGDLRVLAKKNDNSTLMAVLSIYEGTFLYYIGKNDSALVYFDRAILEAQRINNDQLRSTAAIRRLFILNVSKNSAPILTLMKDEYAIAKSNRDTLNMIYSLNGQALCYDNLDSTKACIASYLKAIKLSKSSRNNYEYGFLLNNLGLMKLRLNSPEQAIVDFRKGLAIAKKLKNVRLEVTLRENIGYYYIVTDSLDKAINEYKTTFNLAKSRNYNHLAFHSIANLGAIERRLGNNARGDSLMNVALNIAREEKLMYAISPIFVTMAQLELDAGNYQKVNALLDSAKVYERFSSKNDNTEATLQILYEMALQQGNFESALDYYTDLEGFKDSLNRNGHMQMITELQLKYDFEREQKEREKDKREFEAHASRMRQNIAIAIIVLLVLIGAFIIYYFKGKNKREAAFSAALVNQLEEERGRIARDLHDGLGQSLIILKNKFNKFDPTDVAAAEHIDTSFSETIEEVRSISRSLIPPELRRLGLRKSLSRMLKDVEDSTSIMASAELEALDKIHLETADEVRIYRIIQELTNNTIKHSKASSLKVEFEHFGNRLQITYQDNGKGLDEARDVNQNSVGMKSIEQRLKYLNGTLRIESPNRGFKAVLRIKLKKTS